MWKKVQKELLAFNGSVDNLSDLTIDTLYGSMWGLNMRYMTLGEALIKNKKEIIAYSLQRINKLIDELFFTFKIRPTIRCKVGYGTYGWKYDKKIIKLAIQKASIIDTAEGYGYGRVETELGKILVWNEPVEVNTKVRRDHMSPSAINNSVRRSVEKLNTIPHVQLHFPNNKYPNAVKDLAILRQKGLIKSIGLSNVSIDLIESTQLFLSEYSGDVVNSVQMCFNLLDNRIGKLLIPYCQERGILIMAYSPLGQKFDKLKSPVLSKLARKYDCTEAQIALSWILSFPGVLPIPNTNNIEHLKQNFESNDLYLAKNDILELTNYYDGKNLYGSI
jgi:diketogulonate reductase-like aldo/keto reductase